MPFDVEPVTNEEIPEIEARYALFLDGTPMDRKAAEAVYGQAPWDVARLLAALREARGLGARVSPAPQEAEAQGPGEEEEPHEDDGLNEDDLPVPVEEPPEQRPESDQANFEPRALVT